RGSNSSLTSAQSSYFDYHQDMTADGKPFTSWAEKFGPHDVNGDNYTTLARWNLSDYYTNVSSGGIFSAAQYAIRWNPEMKDTALSGFNNDMPYYRAAAGVSPGVNVRDGLSQNDTAGIALQFVYEEADCRLYYTPEMTVDIAAVWKAAADAQWGQSGKCVAGGNYG
nr:hypothetical protein [Tanacetum cinerariifolium]